MYICEICSIALMCVVMCCSAKIIKLPAMFFFIFFKNINISQSSAVYSVYNHEHSHIHAKLVTKQQPIITLITTLQGSASIPVDFLLAERFALHFW